MSRTRSSLLKTIEVLEDDVLDVDRGSRHRGPYRQGLCPRVFRSRPQVGYLYVEDTWTSSSMTSFSRSSSSSTSSALSSYSGHRRRHRPRSRGPCPRVRRHYVTLHDGPISTDNKLISERVIWLLWTQSRRVDRRWRPCQPTNQSAAICLPLRQ